MLAHLFLDVFRRCGISEKQSSSLPLCNGIRVDDLVKFAIVARALDLLLIRCCTICSGG